MSPAPSTKAEWVFGEIKASILKGELKPNHRLRLKSLAAQYGTSQMPVREALRMLHRDGLVEIQNHRGAIVTDVSIEQGCELLIVRTHLEVLAVEEAVLRHTRATVAEMERILERMEICLERGAGDEFSRLNREFHSVLIAPCGLQSLIMVIDDLWNRMWKVRGKSLFLVCPERMREAHAEHRAVIQAVKARNLRRASRAIKIHRTRNVKAWKALVNDANRLNEG